MKSTAPLCLSLLLVGSCFAFVACGDDDDVGGEAGAGQAGAGPSGEGGTPHGGGSGGSHAGTVNQHGGQGGAGESEGAIECEVIGELCHEADTGSGPGHDCHELGHVANASACVAGFENCITVCVSGDEGAGGAGGAPASDQDAYCAALGELCHFVGDAEEGPSHECHETGHEGDGAACRAVFTDCASLCLDKREALEEGMGGAAGAGGASVGGAGGSQ